VLKRHPGRLPAGALLPIRGRGLPLCAGSGNATRVSPARAARCRCDRQVRETQRPAPDPAGGKRPPRAGRALAGGFGPRRDKDRPCAVAKAMAFANQAAKVQSPVRAGPGNATRVSPARARRCLVDRQVREGQRPAPDPAGGKRPPWAGRVLAGGFGPRPVKDQRDAVAGAMAPARMRKARAGRRDSRFAVRQPMRPALFQHPFKPGGLQSCMLPRDAWAQVSAAARLARKLHRHRAFRRTDRAQRPLTRGAKLSDNESLRRRPA